MVAINIEPKTNIELNSYRDTNEKNLKGANT
jgi:hypothetical protein